MRICIGGRNNIAVDVCKYLLGTLPKDCIYVIPGRNDDGKDNYQRSFLKFARNSGLKVLLLQEIYDWEDLIFLSLEFDRIIHPSKFKSKQLYNIHFSLLPAYKGVYTSALPLLKGERYGGVTLHYIERGIDTGDIIDQVKFEIPNDYKALDMYLRCIDEGTKLVIKNIENILKGNINSYPQPHLGSTYYSKQSINYSNLVLDLNATASQIDCQVRAYSYRPFQLCKVDGCAIFYSEITNQKSKERAGTIIENTVDYYRIASIDYDIVLYKDRLDEVLECAKYDDLESLSHIPHIQKYIDEKETQHGWSSLMVAAYHNSYNVVKFLVEHGANVNNANYNGTTVIMYAKDGCERTGDFKSIDYLLHHGANPNIKDYSEKSLYDYVENYSAVWHHIAKYKNGFINQL